MNFPHIRRMNNLCGNEKKDDLLFTSGLTELSKPCNNKGAQILVCVKIGPVAIALLLGSKAEPF